MTLSKAIAIRLEEIMNEYSMTQYRLYIKSGVSQSTISDIRLQKTKNVSVTVIHELMDALELDLDYFLQVSCSKEKIWNRTKL